ncbi:BNR-4 repeat-containing protein [Corallincola spongiicola]|uniref:HYR domain-containing protein n=1 Tax=Corallincola spongiicola TaxID=2520508 RepID=A0ABY1WLU7_9GAMM|nr:BNR-4 repeat-containing protein [Corallincola spongiicola]TAA42578.1 hypothetical protein EXY25_14900 [Corallincola spongiicola]
MTKNVTTKSKMNKKSPLSRSQFLGCIFFISQLFFWVPNALAIVTLDAEVKVSDKGLYFDGVDLDYENVDNPDTGEKYDYFFGRSISAHGDAVKTYKHYVFMTWYRGGKYDRHVMLSRYNTLTRTLKSIEFPHQHTGFRGNPLVGESHNTIGLAVSPVNGTIHMVYDMHAYDDNNHDGKFRDDFFRYSYSIPGTAEVSDDQFTLDRFVKDTSPVSQGDDDYKHLTMTGDLADKSNFARLTYPKFFTNTDGTLLLYMRLGGNNNGAYVFNRYDAASQKWSRFTNFNLNNQISHGNHENWGLYGDMKYVNGKLRVGFQKRSGDNTDKYQYQNGVYYAYSDHPEGFGSWKTHDGKSMTWPLVDADEIKIFEPGDYFNHDEANSIYIVDKFDWTVTEKGDLHIVSKARSSNKSRPDYQEINFHSYKPAGEDEFIISTDFVGADGIYTSGDNIYIIGLNNGRPYVEKAQGGTNEFTRIYESNSGLSFNHGTIFIDKGKLYYFLMQRGSGNSNPLYLQIIDLDIDHGGPAGFDFSANEQQTVVVSGVMDIAYGTQGQFNYLYGQTENVVCDTSQFGDPFPQKQKRCYTRTVSDPSVQVDINTSASTLMAGYDQLLIEVEAQSGIVDGQVVNTSLYINDQFIRKEAVAPYLWGDQGRDELLGLSVGEHTVKVVAIDDKGFTGEATLLINVVPPSYELNEQHYFDGNETEISFAHPFSLGNQSFGFEANVRPLSNNGVIFEYFDNQVGYQVGLNNGKVIAAIINESGQVNFLSSTSSASLGHWSHIYVNYDHGEETLSLYFNGVLEAQKNVNKITSTTAGNAYVGQSKSHFSNTTPYSGMIDDLLVVRVNKLAQEVEASYTQSRKIPSDQSSLDTDNDGTIDLYDAFPLDATETSDTDSDGVGDNSDVDIDGDGVDNEDDAFPFDRDETHDSDNDGIGDNADVFPNDPDESADADADGVGDNYDALPFNPEESLDIDSDGWGNIQDELPLSQFFHRNNNILRNSDAEQDADYWDSAEPNGSSADITSAESYTGQHSFQLTNNSEGDAVSWKSNLINLSPSTRVLNLSGWVKRSTSSIDEAQVWLRTEQLDDNRKFFISTITFEGNDWQFFSFDYEHTEDIGTISFVRLQLEQSGTVWFDNLSLNVLTSADNDLDGIDDAIDSDDDNDGYLDGEDPAPFDGSIGPFTDDDSDGILDGLDNCVLIANPNQANFDNDSEGDLCDLDDDNDGVPDTEDLDPFNASIGRVADSDADGISDDVDNCVATANPSQVNFDNDSEGDACDLDDDNDGVPDAYELQHGLDPYNSADAEQDLDNDGVSNIDEFLQGSDIAKDDVLPILTPPKNIQVDSTGPLTPVDLGVATAFDEKDGVIVPQVDNAGPFIPGRHIVTWSATDITGNKAQVEQIVDVVPMVNFWASQIIDEGSVAELTVTLNGTPIDYPVTIPLRIRGTAESSEDFIATANEIVIDSGTSKTLLISSVADDIWEGEETIEFTMQNPINAALGSINTHTITLTEENIAPQVSIYVSQNDTPATTVYTDSGQVVISAKVVDPNPDDLHYYDWSLTDNRIAPLIVDEAEFSLDLQSIESGLYYVAVSVEDDVVPPLSASTQSLIRVAKQSPQLSEEQDSDGDGIADSEEGFGDRDGDRIQDYLDATNDASLLPTGINDAMIIGQSHAKLLLGNIAFSTGKNKASVTLEELSEFADQMIANRATARAIGAQASLDQYVNGIFDFLVTHSSTTSTIDVVIPQTATIPDGALYRHYQRGWQDFIIDDQNILMSAPGELGVCPAPGHKSYQLGLNSGDYCIQLSIEDGGLNDADGVMNGIVEHTGGIAMTTLPAPNLQVTNVPVTERDFSSGDGEKVVLAFKLVNDSTDVVLNQLTFAASGELNDVTEIIGVSLYLDKNQNGIPQTTELLSESNYSIDNGEITFEFNSPYQLAVGESHFVLTYKL